MQITNLLPLLIEILASRTGPNKVSKAPPGHDPGGVGRQPTEKTAGSQAVPGTREIVQGDHQAGRQGTTGQVLPDYLPLPLKSPLFNDSSFFIRNSREEAGASGDEVRTQAFIRLGTESLGLIWISLSAGRESLAVSFYTEDDSSIQRLKEIFPDLSKGLRRAGYTSVSVTGTARPGIKDCSDIESGKSAPGKYLLDLEV